MADGNVIRNLAEGPDYAPDWRQQVVQEYLAELATARDGQGMLGAIMFCEKDAYVRQYLRFRFDESSVNNEAFRYALGCNSRNAQGGAASMIKAMIVADRTPDEIAQELGTRILNIVAFGKIFFDVRRYLDNESLLRRIVFADPQEGMAEAEALRERRWMAAAFHRGWEGVERVVFHRGSSSPEDVEALSLRLQSTLASRALEYALELETSGATPTEADLARFMAARNMQSRQAPASSSDATGMDQLRNSVLLAFAESEKRPDDPDLAVFREAAALKSHPAQLPVRRRSRFNEQ